MKHRHWKLKIQFSENKQGYLILFLLELRTVHTSTFGNTQHDSFLNIMASATANFYSSCKTGSFCNIFQLQKSNFQYHTFPTFECFMISIPISLIIYLWQVNILKVTCYFSVIFAVTYNKHINTWQQILIMWEVRFAQWCAEDWSHTGCAAVLMGEYSWHFEESLGLHI